MKFAVIENGIVVNVALADAPIADNWIQLKAGVNIGDTWDGEQFLPPVPSPAAVQAEIIAATQARLDSFAQTRSYDGILSACTYATSTVAKFQAEGRYCVEARDATWAALYQVLADVEAGLRPAPSGYADIEPDLPVLAWPDSSIA